ncbi:hypothetical protein [Marinobacter shengliensis]|uniref:Uncharacterized protein n=1 Tax=Marinobacter shengliensis TaxID=1389223 RepID=A0ABV4WCF9_9GAMM
MERNANALEKKASDICGELASQHFQEALYPKDHHDVARFPSTKKRYGTVPMEKSAFERLPGFKDCVATACLGRRGIQSAAGASPIPPLRLGFPQNSKNPLK